MDERKLTLTFEKTGDVRFISHLDMARVFTRAFRRARVPLKCSEGFHAHPKLVFSLPLSVGVESLCETCTVTIPESEVTDDLLQTRLNETLPTGIRVTAVSDDTQKKARTNYAHYDLTFQNAKSEALKTALSQPLPIEKRTKKGKKIIDLAPLLHEPRIEEVPGGIVLSVLLPLGDEMTVNPALLTEALKASFPALTLTRALRRECLTYGKER